MNRKITLILLGAAVIAFVLYGITSYFSGSVTGPTTTVENVTTTTIPDANQVMSGGTEYRSDTYGFSVRYPDGYRVDDAYSYKALGPNTDIPGVSFTIPASLTAGTNLSQDSYLSVEKLPSGRACEAASFISNMVNTQRVDENGRTWTVVKGGDAGAGNFYDETVYILQDGSDCFGIRQFIHSTNVGNYDPGTVIEFDRVALDGAFAQFRASFTR